MGKAGGRAQGDLPGKTPLLPSSVVTPGMTGHGTGLVWQGSQECQWPALPAQARSQSGEALVALPHLCQGPQPPFSPSPLRPPKWQPCTSLCYFPPATPSPRQSELGPRVKPPQVASGSRPVPPHSGCSAAAPSVRPPGGHGARSTATLPGFVGAGLAEHIQRNP